MRENYYNINMQLLLYMVQELHKRGFEGLRVIPSIAPSGLSWRCSFVSGTDSERGSTIASNWISINYNLELKIESTIPELTDRFIKEHVHFMNECKAENKEYVAWYENMLQQLEEGELPYAFGEYFSPTDYWRTSKGNTIRTLPDERRFYDNY